jgi:hypothetical protein
LPYALCLSVISSIELPVTSNQHPAFSGKIS